MQYKKILNINTNILIINQQQIPTVIITYYSLVVLFSGAK